MISAHPFMGAMDLDSPDEDIDPRMCRELRNVTWRGNPGNMRPESVLGTIGVPNPFLPATGANKCIGAFFDDVDQVLYDCNYNTLTDINGILDPTGAGTGAIYLFNKLTGVWQRLIEDGINTTGNVLGFNNNNRIMGIKLIYGDPANGILAYIVNSLGQPTVINVTKYLAAPPNPILREYLEVIKAAPPVPPRVVYENDNNVNANNCTNSLFQFAYTGVSENLEETPFSSGSVLALPSIPFSNTTNTDKTKCARMALYLNTLGANFKKLNIYMRQTQNGITSGWFLVDTIIKANTGLPDNSVYRYQFYNSGNYIPADPKFAVLLQDSVPLKTNCQELLNGDTLAYSGITEGYDWFKSTFSSNLTFNNNEDVDYIINGVLFFGEWNGTFTGGLKNFEIFVTGEGTNAPAGNVIKLSNVPENFYVLAKLNDTTDIGFNTGTFGDGTISVILAAIGAAAVVAGWQVIVTNLNSIVIAYNAAPGDVKLTATRIENRFLDVNNISYQLAFYPESNQSFGLVYYDRYGRTNGVITDVSANLSTLPYNSASNTTITNIQLNLNGIIPPPWAYYYHVVRTNTLTYNKHLHWVSNQAFSNVNMLVETQYAYIGISNIADYNISIQASQGVVGYDFTQGDRIRFIGRFNASKNFTTLTFDYPILGVATNPIINGTTQTGSYIKIAYPTADIGANFAFNGDPDFQNYYILLYSVTSNSASASSGSTSSTGNVYYEFGQQYFIGKAGTINAFHYGNLGDNQVIFNDGDIFARQRTVPAGNTYYLNSGLMGFGSRYATALITTPTLVVTGQYQIGTQTNLVADPSNPAAYPRIGDANGLYQNLSANLQTIRLSGILDAFADAQTWLDIIVKVDKTPTSAQQLYIIKHSDGIPTGTTKSIDFTGEIGVPTGAKAWLIWGNGESQPNIRINGFLLRLDVINNITIDVFDPSFSDVYNLRTNSNSRPIVQDIEAKQTYYSTLMRYSLQYQVGTTKNNTNRFYPNNFDEFDRAYGAVIRMRVWQRELRIFQERRCGRTGIYAKFIQDSSGGSLVTTDAIINANNIDYFAGQYGIGNQGDSLVSSGFQDYFADPVKGYWCRLSQDGITPISEIYKVQSYAGDIIPRYLPNNHFYPWGGFAQIIGCFHFSKDRAGEVIFAMQVGALADQSDPIGQESISFREDGNAWTSKYDYAPDSIVCCGNSLFSFWNGVLYSHTNNLNYCQFYGGQHKPNVSFIRNENSGVDKTWIGMGMISNVKWISPLMYTNAESYLGQRQESKIVASDVNRVEGRWKTSFRNDIHSRGGFGYGQRLKGTLFYVNMTVEDGSKFAYISGINIKANVSQPIQR